MHIVIKGTKTISEFKDRYAYLEQKANEFKQKHNLAFSNWKDGEIKKVWLDTDQNICIEYESGNWWHYRLTGNTLEWW